MQSYTKNTHRRDLPNHLSAAEGAEATMASDAGVADPEHPVHTAATANESSSSTDLVLNLDVLDFSYDDDEEEEGSEVIMMAPSYMPMELTLLPHVPMEPMELTPRPPPARFEYLFALPLELREEIYGHVFTRAKPILPHLCNEDADEGRARFHDDNAPTHGSMYAFTALTRASRQLRKESLRVFYETNTFAVGPDTTTYFTYLKAVGRFNSIHHVSLDIPLQPPHLAAWVLRCVHQYDTMAAAHKLEEQAKHAKEEPTTLVNASCAPLLHHTKTPPSPPTAATLRSHPRYLAGGISALNLAILTRMLSTSLPPNAHTHFTRRIVLPLPSAMPFTPFPSLQWFPPVVQGLGIELRIAVRPESAHIHDRLVALTWATRFQGLDCAKDTLAAEVTQDTGVMARALDMFPGLEDMRRPGKTCYYRQTCGAKDSIEWFDLVTLGGGRW